jgi:hypothetical protein
MPKALDKDEKGKEGMVKANEMPSRGRQEKDCTSK